MDFGSKIVQLRKDKSLSRDKLAKEVGTSSAIIGRYERNEITPSVEVAAKIADALGVSLDYLVGGSDKMILDKKLVKRIEDIEALPAEEKDKVYYFIDMALSHHKAKKAFAK